MDDAKIARGAERALHLHRQGVAYGLAIWQASRDVGCRPQQIARELNRRAALRRKAAR